MKKIIYFSTDSIPRKSNFLWPSDERFFKEISPLQSGKWKVIESFALMKFYYFSHFNLARFSRSLQPNTGRIINSIYTNNLQKHTWWDIISKLNTACST